MILSTHDKLTAASAFRRQDEIRHARAESSVSDASLTCESGCHATWQLKSSISNNFGGLAGFITKPKGRMPAVPVNYLASLDSEQPSSNQEEGGP